MVAFSTGEVELRDHRNVKVLRAMRREHEENVMSVAISADGGTVVSGSWNGTVRL